MKILIYLIGGTHWLGGVQYTANLLHALCLLPPSERPDIVLDIGQKNQNIGFENQFLKYRNIVKNQPINNKNLINKFKLFMIRIIKKIFRTNIRKKLLLSDYCTVAFPVKSANIVGPFKKIYWIPDFQYKRHPEFFEKTERQMRDMHYEKMLLEEGILVLSSEAAKSDFLTFFPSHRDKAVRVLHFHSIIADDYFEPDPVQICARYGLPKKFVYVANQFWQHKGFETAFEALSRLRKQGVVIPLVCTGSFEDYRNAAYFQQLKELISSNGLESQIYLLGILPRMEQVQIFRCASIVLQPSLFEGWSTSVEDARALGKKIILSDIDVHREQNPLGAVFFEKGNADDLSSRLLSSWQNADLGLNLSLEKEARSCAKDLGLKYARNFIEILKEADALRANDL